MNLPCPGTGLFYAGARRRGLVVVAMVAAALAGITSVQLAPPTPATVVLTQVLAVAGLLILLASTALSWAQARRARREGRGRPPLRAVLFVVVGAFLLQYGIGVVPLLTGTAWLHMHMESRSMLPNMQPGTRLYVGGGAMPGRGMLAVFRPYAGQDVQFVFRVVGIAGDVVQLRGGRLLVNGVPAAGGDLAEETLGGRSYRILPMTEAYSGGANTPAITVPPGHIFVLGDNRGNAMDSRFPQIGPVPLSRVDGTGAVSYWTPGQGYVLRRLD